MKSSIEIVNASSFFDENRELINRLLMKALYKFNAQSYRQYSDDLFQSLVCKMLRYEYLNKYDSHKSKISYWLFIIVESVVADFLRKEKLNSFEFIDVEAMSVETFNNESVSICIPKLLLSKREEEVVRLFIDEDMCSADIAEFLSISEGAVRSIKHKSLKKLRAYFLTEQAGSGVSHDYI